MPRLRHLRPADYRVMPWKNGLGTTTEIAVDPPGSRWGQSPQTPGAGLDAFTWRISVADLGASGPFSTFAGYDRLLVQIEGAPMTLSHEGGGEHRLRLLVPYRFAGELATHGTLSAAPARDFNVMVCRDRASAEILVHQLSPGEAARVAGERETRILHALRGAASAQIDGEPAALLAGETLVAEPAASIALTAGGEGAVLLTVAVGPPGR
jgi:uncharacterized protein